MQASYNIRLDEELKETAFSVFDSYGISPAQAIRLFLKQVAHTRAIPLSLDWEQVREPNEETKQAIEDARREYATAERYGTLEDALQAMKKIANE
ncbi:MAG: type II toxin-antitoxin system RelB/DinJ family antitoxin [Tenacibaculum sp.]|nr:type II toxin-antitoxin system RelB/DinJ family antitoxin [Tenacibaculum sp.]